jgi:hypothetical protein
MNNQFDELARELAQSVTRRGALKKFGVGIAGIALASLGLPKKAGADPIKYCVIDADCPNGMICSSGVCTQTFHNCQCHQPGYGCGTDSQCVSYCAEACQKKKGGGH